MENEPKETDLQFLMRSVIGKKVLRVNAGGSTGSIFCLELGDELHIKQENGREIIEGDFSIMVYSSWRLDDTQKLQPITGCQEDSGLEGKMTLSLKDLVNDVIEDIVISAFYDLDIKFNNGKRLAVFCDLTPNQKMDTNWFFRNHKQYYSVQRTFDLVVE